MFGDVKIGLVWLHLNSATFTVILLYKMAVALKMIDETSEKMKNEQQSYGTEIKVKSGLVCKMINSVQVII